ncbi:cytochrome c-type biogenesis protein CcmH [Gallibacterium trehalosifermentans]|uniref:Cytochrome c-type biogenesis protein n=1 Tax=Gallibacterium trehalosifermentans TaxID=516935 RepID=A0ABV6H1Z1_9PAST
MKRILLLFAVIFLANSAIAAIEALHFRSPAEEQTYHELTQELRCPQCQNNNIADSNALVATDMRAKVLELLQQNKSKQEIIDYMVARYGNFVTYDPPVTAGTIILWIAPLLLVFLGIGILVRRRKNLPMEQHIESSLDAEQQARLQQLLEKEKEQ